MKLNKLIGENFQSFEKLELDFSKITLAGIIGKFKNNSEKSNGSGKSTIFDLINFILYGEARTDTQRELITDGCKFGGGYMEFVKDGNTIGVSRYIKGKSASIKLEVNGKDKSETGDTQREIVKIMGMDSKVFSATVFFNQEKNDEFTGATPTKRKEYLKKILSLDFYDRCYEENNKRIKALKTEIQVLQGKKSVIVESMGGETIPAIKLDLIEADGRLEMIDEDLAKNEKIINKNQKAISELKSVNQRIENYKSFLDQTKEDIEEKEESIEELEDEKKRLKKAISGRSLKGLKEQLQINSISLKKCETLKEKISVELFELKAQRNSIKTTAVKFKEKSNCYICNNKIEKSKKEKMLNRWRSDFIKLKDQINDLKEMKASSEEKLKELMENDSRMTKAILSFNNFDTRLKKITDDLKFENNKLMELDRKRIKGSEGLSELINQKKKFTKDKKIDIGKITEEISKLKEERDEWIHKKAIIEQKLNKVKKYEKDLNRLNKEIGEKEKLIRAYEVLRNVFGKNGITATIIGAFLIDIEDDANEILQEVEGSSKLIRFENFKDTKKGIKDTLEIYIDTKKGSRKYESFSKGQKTIENFSLRLALAKTLLKKEGSWIGAVFLDEVFANLDKYNRRKIIGVLNYLKQFFNQILVISHTDIQDVFPNLIEVEFNPFTEISKIKRVS